MKREELLWAMSDIAPELILQAERPPVRRRRGLRFGLLLAAAVALIGVVSALAVQRWHRPQAQTYTGDTVKVQSQTDYVERTDGSYEAVDGAAAEQTEDTARNDAFFLREAVRVLRLLGVEKEEQTLHLQRELEERWNREQVRVSFPTEDGDEASVLFDAQSGYLIGVSTYHWAEMEQQPMDEAQALQTAQAWYELLPYPQGYEYTAVNQFDEGAWMYMFGRNVTVSIAGEQLTLVNDYEQVRITIDPRDGSFLMSNCFYVPLLDDHAPEDQPLGREEAIRLAQSVYARSLEDWQASAEYAIVLPNTFYDARESSTEPRAERAYDVTRLAWVVTFSTTEEVLDEQTGEVIRWESARKVYVDLYTGEILGGDMTA